MFVLIELMTSRLLSGCTANWAKLSLPWRPKGPSITLRGAEKKGVELKKGATTTPPHHHHKKNTTPNTKNKHNHPTTKTPPHHQKKTRPHQHKNTTTPPPQQHNHTTTPFKNTTTTPPQKHHHITSTETPPQKNTTKAPPSRKHRHTTTAKKASASPAMPTLKLCGTTSETMSERRPDAGAALLVCHPLQWPFLRNHIYMGFYILYVTRFFVSYQRALWFAGGHLIWRAACGTTSGTTSKRRPAVKSRPCLETMLQLAGQQLQAPICCTVRTPASTLSTVQSAGQHMERQGHMLFPSLPDLLRSKLECPGSPPYKDPNYAWSWGPAELHVERRLERRQNDVQAQGL